MQDFNGTELKVGNMVFDRIGDAGVGKIVEIYTGTFRANKGKPLARIKWDNSTQGDNWREWDLLRI